MFVESGLDLFKKVAIVGTFEQGFEVTPDKTVGGMGMSEDKDLLYLRTEADVDRAIEAGRLRPELKPRLLKVIQEEAQGGLVVVDLDKQPAPHHPADDCVTARPDGFTSYH